jgi:rhodanese-related sulfurtransferase
MNEYELDGDQLIPRERASERAATLDRESREQSAQSSDRIGLSGIEKLLTRARSRLRRLSPAEAHEEVATTGAVLVDIRPEGQRAIEGAIPGALIVERNVLEWRFDPTSSARLAAATDYGVRVIVFCSEGYSSSLAAAALQDLGLWSATDLIGGFHAWHAFGLPIVPPRQTLRKRLR